MSHTQNPSSLPTELPETWIEQIKKATRKESWKVILFTTLFTASLALGSNLLIEKYRSRSAINLESIRAQNALIAKQREEKQKLVLPLGDKMGQLDEKLAVAVKTFQSSSSNAKLIKAAQASFDDAKVVMTEIYALNRDVRLPRDLSEMVGALLNELAPRLIATDDPKNLAQFATYYDNECRPKMLKIRELIQTSSENQ
jgi:hypothetical protein